jgi:hypothetical protein
MVPRRIRFSEVKVGGPQVEEIRMCELGINNKLFEVGDSGCMDKQMRRQNGDILASCLFSFWRVFNCFPITCDDDAHNLPSRLP